MGEGRPQAWLHRHTALSQRLCGAQTGGQAAVSPWLVLRPHPGLPGPASWGPAALLGPFGTASMGAPAGRLTRDLCTPSFPWAPCGVCGCDCVHAKPPPSENKEEMTERHSFIHLFVRSFIGSFIHACILCLCAWFRANVLPPGATETDEVLPVPRHQ